jgi:N-carbamoyl-L-amino-acid hydrolase
MLGVLAGIATVRALDAAAVRLRHPLETIDFLAEEPTPFGISCIGSTAIAGEFDITKLALRDQDGRTLATALATLGGDPESLAAVARRPGDIAAYLELHIEQGRVLEDAGAPLGIVQGIVGIRRATLHFLGRPDHAGTTPMALRHDALAAAAETILAVERAARAVDGTIGTVGALYLSPNQQNVVPGAAELTVEVRSLAWPAIERLWSSIVDDAHVASRARGVELAIDGIEEMAPMRVPDWLIAVIGEACAAVAPGAPQLPSGAGHDGSRIGRIAPAGMIFVRSRDGRSHCPEEYSSPEDIAAGVTALGRALLALDRQLDALA